MSATVLSGVSFSDKQNRENLDFYRKKELEVAIKDGFSNWKNCYAENGDKFAQDGFFEGDTVYFFYYDRSGNMYESTENPVMRSE